MNAFFTTRTSRNTRGVSNEGKILQIPLNKVTDRIVPRPFVDGRYGAESETLLRGTYNNL